MVPCPYGTRTRRQWDANTNWLPLTWPGTSSSIYFLTSINRKWHSGSHVSQKSHLWSNPVTNSVAIIQVPPTVWSLPKKQMLLLTCIFSAVLFCPVIADYGGKVRRLSRWAECWNCISGGGGGGGGCRKFGLLFFSLGKKCKKGLNQKLKSSPMCFMKPMMLCK